MTPSDRLARLFVTFEGIDGSGKSTQASMLRDLLSGEGYKVALFREPGGTAIGEQVRKILLNTDHAEMLPSTELFLYAAARAQLTAEMIKPALDDSDVVICDRYLDSTTVYQGYGRGIDISLIDQMNDVATGSIRPDLTFVLDVEVHVGDARVPTEDRLEQEASSFKQRLRDGYRKLVDKHPSRVVLLDGSLPAEEIARKVWESVAKRLPKRQTDPVRVPAEGE